MKHNHLLLKSLTKILLFIFLTFRFYLFFPPHNNPPPPFIPPFIFTSPFILIFLPFHLNEVFKTLPIHFKKLIIIPSLISLPTPSLPIFFPNPFLYQTQPNLTFPLLPHLHLTTLTLFHLPILLTLLPLILTLILSITPPTSSI
nr:MnhB domain-containing protein [Staphylococcus epidermidis]